LEKFDVFYDDMQNNSAHNVSNACARDGPGTDDPDADAYVNDDPAG